MFNLCYICGGDFDHLNQYYETFHNQRKNAKKLGSLFASDAFRDLVMTECKERKDTGSNLYILLYAWKTKDAERLDSDDDAVWELQETPILVRQQCLNEKMTLMLFFKRSSAKYELYCQELYNACSNGHNNFPLTMQGQHTRLDT